MEFIRMCEDLNYYNLVISMKSSNPQVMVQAYRMLVETMVKEGMNYPLHLGVTEAGDGEDGRIKSAVGIGTLLEDGLGDTIRVSLTEDPEFEAPVAIALANRYEVRGRKAETGGLNNSQPTTHNSQLTTSNSQLPSGFNPYEYLKRETTELNTFIGGHQVPRVVVDLSERNLKDPAILNEAGYVYSAVLDKYNMAEQSVDFVYLADSLPSFTFPGNLKQLYNYATWSGLKNKANCHPVFTLPEYRYGVNKDKSLNFVRVTNKDVASELFGSIQVDNTLVFILETGEEHGMADQRQFFFSMMEMGLKVPVIVKRSYQLSTPNSELPTPNSLPPTPNSQLTTPNSQPIPQPSDFQLYAATDIGALFVDGFGDGVWLDAPEIGVKTIVSTSFGILQATRSRISKTEYISCPSCGRTLFDLQETTQMIRSRTDHLKGLKIGIMGCIVNGPGEMADADYGYVGTGPGKITLYRGKQVVKKSVNTADALDELIEIIREDGNWIDPE